MRKIFLLFVMVLTYAYGENNQTSNVEIYATKIESKNNIVYAKDEVVVLYKGQYFSAQEVTYDRNQSLVTLHGNINVLKGAEFHAVGEHITLNLNEEERTFTPLFLLEKASGIWMSAQEANTKHETMHLSSGMVSGCNPQKPLWKLYFSSADYNQESKWMHLYNTRLHLYNIPIFYIPYFAYPTDTKRRSGLLFPSIGFSSDEGIYYEQPIYIALYNSWDLELRPQIRTQRGKGIYSTLRFKDSKVSGGEITTGYFQENGKYSALNNLANEKHFGVEFKYSNVNWLDAWFGISTTAQSEFFTDIKWMNDVDYMNLSSVSQTNDPAISELSVLNMFYNEEKHYVGAYFKYFLDLTQQNSSSVVQSLPSLQYHHYLETFLENHLLFNVDVRAKNYHRDTGLNAEEAQVVVPLALQTALFDNYLDASYTLNNNLQAIHVHGEQSTPQQTFRDEKGVYGSVNGVARLSSSLSKSFKQVEHSMEFSVAYTDPGSNYSQGYYETSQKCNSANTLLFSDEYCSFDTRENIVESTSLSFKQFVYDKSDLEQLLYHKVEQFVGLSETRQDFKALENEMEIRLMNNFSFYSDSFYDYKHHGIVQSYNRISYDTDQLRLSTASFYANELNTTNSLNYENYYIFDAQYRYNKHYKYFTRYLYDFENSVKKSVEVGFLYSKRCWDFGLRYLENLRPILSNDGLSNSISDHFIFVTVRFKPIGGSEFNYKMDNNLQRD